MTDAPPPAPPSSDAPAPPPPPPPPSAPPPPPPPAPEPPAASSGGGGSGSDIDIGGWMSEAWTIVLANPIPMIAGFLVVGIALSLSAVVVVGPLILTGPFLIACTQVSKRSLDGQSPEIGELFSGFDNFGRTCIAGLLLIGVLVAKGIVDVVLNIVLASIPCLGSILGLIISVGLQVAIVALTFVFIPIVTFRQDVEPVEALTKSAQFAMDNLQPMLLLSAAVFGLNLVGFFACGLGMLVTIPMAVVIQVLAYERYYLPRS